MLLQLNLESHLRSLQTFKPKANGLHSLNDVAWIKTLNLEIVFSFCLLQMFLPWHTAGYLRHISLGNKRICTYHSVLAVQMKN